jgi:hypothetical protein
MRGPHGGDAYTVGCGAGVPERCYERAADLCPKGYEILDHERETVLAATSRHIATYTPEKLSLVVECTGT